MSLDSTERKLPVFQVKAAPVVVSGDNQAKQAMDRASLPRSQDVLSSPVFIVPGSSPSKSPKPAAGGAAKSSHGMTKKPSFSSNRSKQKAKLKKQVASTSTGLSESDDSDEDFDNGDRHGDGQLQDSRLSSSSVSRSVSSMMTSQRMAEDGWEILEGLRNGQLFREVVPQKYSGYMMKSRKWPMKGWHKRFFQLDNGILTYGKTPGDIEKGKRHGVVDIAHSVIACKRNGRRIDVDADDLIYHMKVKTVKEFDEWTTHLRHHRLHRHHEISYGAKEVQHLVAAPFPTAKEFSSLSSPLSPDDIKGGFEHADGSGRARTVDGPQGKVSTWLAEANDIDGWERGLSLVQLRMFELGTTLEKLHSATSAGSSVNIHEFQDLAISPISKKPKSPGRRLLLSRPSKKERKGKDRLSVADGLMSIHLSTSNPNLLTMDEPIAIGAPAGNATMSSDARDFDRLHELFYHQAEKVHGSLKAACRAICSERDRLKQALESDDLVSLHNSTNYVQSLKQTLAEAIKQNADYRNRLNRINADSGLTDLKPIVPPICLSTVYVASGPPSEKERVRFTTTGSIDSLSEFYDAAERLDSSTDVSEDQEEEEEDEDVSDTESKPLPEVDELHDRFTRFQMRRRSKLPSPKLESDVGVWSLLRKNIGKDLSKISMPVSMNEPLNALQRLCEELEYSEMLDRCVEFDDPFERMVWMAAFAVSGYSSTFTRAGQKPFNPILGETYEIIREDKGWKFVAEQVSHHPPVSACFCESKNFLFWEDMQVKTKFWGKSMEVEPTGFVNVKLIKQKEHYSWNKATSCVHNILGGQRWVEHYGEVNITNHTLEIACKLTFAKSSYWSSNRHEVYGSVFDRDGRTVHHLFGKWNEGIYYGDIKSAKCIWRPGAMPSDSSVYYGFTRFAMELNEIDSEQLHLYPPTDTRFRPDQRLLEDGKLSEAESEKQRLEQRQREIRKRREEDGATYAPKWFNKSDPGSKDAYQFNGQYWEVRKTSGFSKLDLPVLW